MYSKEIKKIIEQMAIEKNISTETKRMYNIVLNQYCNYHQQTITQLIEEADKEEENHTRMKRRKIKQRLLTFREHLKQKGNMNTTINNKITLLVSFYRFYEVETPHIYRLTNKQHETIQDIPTKEQIKLVIESTNNLRLKAILIFLTSSGCASNEALHITINDFINATSNYHHEDNISDVVRVLKHKDDVVPTFFITRIKTNKPYFTYCTPECVQFIVRYLDDRLNREQINGNDYLFNIHPVTLRSQIKHLNDKLSLGQKNGRAFFHAHALRKYFATTLYKHDVDVMTIDFLCGRSISSTHEAYFKADPKRLHEKYMLFMKHLTLFEDVDYRTINSKEREELELLRERNKEQEERLRDVERILNRLV